MANGKGGGKPDLAQAGGVNNGQIDSIVSHIEQTVLNQLKSFQKAGKIAYN